MVNCKHESKFCPRDGHKIGSTDKFINLYPHGKAPYWTMHYTEEIARESAEEHAIEIALRIAVKK